MSKLQTFDVVVLGAGGAGLMCAAHAGKQGKQVVVLDHLDRAGSKIVISGGGRCNFTNVHANAGCFLSQNPHFAKSALGRYSPNDFIELVEKHGIAWHEKTLGQLFCDGTAKQIVAMLLDECAESNVAIRLEHSINSVKHSDTGFLVKTNRGDFTAASLVVATGGPSIPKMGATGFAYDLARQFKLKVVEPRPGLVPLTLGADDVLFRELSGVSTEVIVQHDSTHFREAALFTHKGLSGPAMLQISSYWRHGDPISIDFFPDEKPGWILSAKLNAAKSTVAQQLGRKLPARLAAALAEQLAESGALAGSTNQRLAEIEDKLTNWVFEPNGTEGFAKAEVTVGGVSTHELSSKTMESKKVPGLYFIGEAVDVTGWLGGYNFQWAWASGVAAGQAV